MLLVHRVETNKVMAYSKEDKENIFNEVCRLISEDGLSLRKALINQGIISKTFYKWVDDDESKEKGIQYARACEDRVELLADELIEISDEQNADTYLDDDGRCVTDGAAIQRSRLKVDTRKWLMSKMNPKKYSDKLQLDNTPFAEQPFFPDVSENDGNK